MNNKIRECLKNHKLFEGCKLCMGKGYITAWQHSVSDRCPRCEGDGIVSVLCDTCGGKGFSVQKFKDISHYDYEIKKMVTMPDQVLCKCGACNGEGKVQQ